MVLDWLPCYPNDQQTEATIITAIENSTSDETYICVHYEGIGERVNQLTLTYGMCASCNGAGKVD